MESGKFAHYDYGYLVNFKYYWSNSAPEIPLETICIPVAMFMASDDQIADIRDNEDLRKRIPKVVHWEVLPDEDHLSLSFSKDMTYFRKVMAVMKGYTD